MSAILLRLLVYAIILGAIYFGLKRIINDWRARFRQEDDAARERDLRERQRPDVIDLSPGEDGVFRPGGDDNKKP